MNRCEHCGQALTDRTARARFCNSACSLAAFRASKVAQAREALELLADHEPAPSSRAMFASIREPDPRGSTWQERLAYLTRTSPTIVSSFGESVLLASAKPMPAGQCRWCVAAADAKVHKNRKPTWDAAHKLLLGNRPCPKCCVALRNNLNLASRVHPPGVRRRSATASGPKPIHEMGCALCTQAPKAARLGDRSVLVASAAPHRRSNAYAGYYLPGGPGGRKR